MNINKIIVNILTFQVKNWVSPSVATFRVYRQVLNKINVTMKRISMGNFINKHKYKDRTILNKKKETIPNY